MLECHFSWHAQHLAHATFGDVRVSLLVAWSAIFRNRRSMCCCWGSIRWNLRVAWTRNVAIEKRPRKREKLPRRRWQVRVRIMFVSNKFHSYLGMPFFGASAIFGNVWEWALLLCTVQVTFHICDEIMTVIFVAVVTFGDVGVSLCVTGRIFGDITWHDATWHDLAWHLATNHFTPPHITNHITASHLAANHITSHTTSQHITSPPPTHHGNTTSHHQNATTMNGRRLVHTKTSVWASQWLVAVCRLYTHVFLWSIPYFRLETSAPGLHGSTCIHSITMSWFGSLDRRELTSCYWCPRL